MLEDFDVLRLYPSFTTLILDSMSLSSEFASIVPSKFCLEG